MKEDEEKREGLIGHGYCAVRSRGDGAFLDLYTLSAHKCGAQLLVKKTSKSTPNWSERHPVVRIAKVEVKEVQEPEGAREQNGEGDGRPL